MTTTKVAALLAGMLIAGSAQATLIDRGGGLIYDDVLDITWLQDANCTSSATAKGPAMSKQYTRKIGQNRGKPRLWLEGGILLDHGFHHGCSWEAVTVGDGCLMLKAGPQGSRRVAGTVDRPIIDINSGAILEGFGGHWVTIEVVTRGKLRVIKGQPVTGEEPL